MKPKPAIVNTGNLAHAAKLAEYDARRAAVLERKDEFLELYMNGCSFAQAVELLDVKESPNYVRLVITKYCREEFVLAQRSRAHSLVEQAVDVARMAVKLGDSGGFRVATDAMFKAAGKLAPEEYGERSKMEVTGKNGGPIALAAGNLTDEQLAQIIANGSLEGVE
jgi:hypothetical protein